MLNLDRTYYFFTLLDTGIDFGDISLGVIIDLIYLILSKDL